MKILADLHHYDLFYSFQLLFEKRLGWELFRPIGMEWYTEGFWSVYSHPDTAKQYLGLDQPSAGPPEDGIYPILDMTKDRVQFGITLQKFRDTKFDVILASIPQHIAPFIRLTQLYQPSAKLIFQIGNPGWSQYRQIRNVMSSTRFPVASGMNTVFYHQEFDTDVFRYEPPVRSKRACSYIHYMNTDHLSTLRPLLPDWEFVTHGAGMEKNILKSVDLAQTIRDSGFTYHWKPLGDGYGHTLHNSIACGRPLITNRKFYSGMCAEPLLADGVTCVDLGVRNVHDTANFLRNCSFPDVHQKMCEETQKRFQEIVNFDKEEIEIRKFIERLV